VHGHQVPLCLTFHDFTYTLEPSLPMDNYEIALEQQGGNDYSTPRRNSLHRQT